VLGWALRVWVLYKQTEDNQDVKHNPEGEGGLAAPAVIQNQTKPLRNQKAKRWQITALQLQLPHKNRRGNGYGAGGGVALGKRRWKIVKRNFAISLCTWKTVINLMKECCAPHLPDTWFGANRKLRSHKGAGAFGSFFCSFRECEVR